MVRRFSRRQVVKYGVGAAAFVALPPTMRLSSSRSARCGGPVEMPQPKVLKSKGNELAVKLTCMEGRVDMGVSQQVKTYTYDQVVPGHTWELDPGDSLRVDLLNKLPKIPRPAVVDLNRPHAWTTTNLHTHGMHVSPAGNADNIFLEVPPGERQHYEIPVSEDHPGGIFWYHPHRHGAVTQQVRGGMGGMIVVRGEIDQVEEVHAAKEQIMVLQAIELGDDFELLDPIPNPSKQEAFFPRTQILYTVNGVMKPKITMYPGEVQRWRLVNAAEGKFMSLRLDEHELNVLAWDGLTLATPDAVKHVMMSAGNRVEVLVKAGGPGTYELVLTPGSSQHPDIPGMPDEFTRTHKPSMVSSELDPRPILTVEVVGEGPEMRLPTSLPVYDPPILPIAKKRRLRYTVERGPGVEFKSFGVNGVSFDPKRFPYQMKLGTAEEWKLVNDLDEKYELHAHVFHIHVNPFKVTQINGRKLETPLWRDTFVLTGTDRDSIVFESNFDDFTGKFVEHCHVLSHEDLGMMEALEVIT